MRIAGQAQMSFFFNENKGLARYLRQSLKYNNQINQEIGGLTQSRL